ncbi:MAG: hypothetical protein ATN35_03505 [Epulopiscium sp. Nele67-Bin004]|nr:MAG: hypothetical protein ATN35_03505 [Epulopiscium sp. Nele67-Bin004]
MKKHKIIEVQEYSIAEEMEIEAGDLLVSINGQQIVDVFDYRYLLSDEFIEVEIEKPNKSRWILEIEKEIPEDLGLIFETELMDDLIRCRNKCKFCFIDQLPPNMRKTVYFKDDDWRLSFLNGNYITLTNMSEFDMERLIKYRLSPINISIHATDADVRKSLLHNKHAGKILEQIERLVKSGIKINGQIVLCKGINDGDILEKTIKDLSEFIPDILSLTIVPVGISRFRENLPYLESFDKPSAKVVIDIVKRWQKYYFEKMDTRFVYAADEFYVVADQDALTYEEYEGFQVLDNGVGMLTKFRTELTHELSKYEQNDISLQYVCVTGKIAEKFMRQNTQLVSEKFCNIEIDVQGVTNHFFGENVTVTGLLTGQDIVAHLKDKNVKNKTLLIAENMLKCGEPVFLDDYTTMDVEQQLGCTIQIVSTDGDKWLQAITKTNTQQTNDKRRGQYEQANSSNNR